MARDEQRGHQHSIKALGAYYRTAAGNCGRAAMG
jgi:hypothetical protein